jgi:hypothetical protein
MLGQVVHAVGQLRRDRPQHAERVEQVLFEDAVGRAFEGVVDADHRQEQAFLFEAEVQAQDGLVVVGGVEFGGVVVEDQHADVLGFSRLHRPGGGVGSVAHFGGDFDDAVARFGRIAEGAIVENQRHRGLR